MLETTITSASSPAGAVAVLPPSPSNGIDVMRRLDDLRGSRWPRTHLGPITFSVRTFSRPSAFMVVVAQPMARVRFSDPVRRAP